MTSVQPPVINDKAEDLLRSIEAVKGAVEKILKAEEAPPTAPPTVASSVASTASSANAVVPTPVVPAPLCCAEEQLSLQKNLKALAYKIDPFAEMLLAFIEKEKPQPKSEVAKAAPAPPPPPCAAKSAPKAPSLLVPRTKKPAAQAGGKKPAIKKHSGATKLHTSAAQEDLSKGDKDIIPEVVPGTELVPKPIQWQGLDKAQAKGTVWADLLVKDRAKQAAREVYARYKEASDLSSSGVDFPSVSPRQRPRSILADRPGGAADSAPDLVSMFALEEIPDLGSFKFEVNFSELNKLFFEREEDKARAEKKPTIADDAAAAAKNRPVSILDSMLKVQMVEINLKGLDIPDNNLSVLKNAYDKLLFASDATVNAGASLSASKHRSNEWVLTQERIERLKASYTLAREMESRLKKLKTETFGEKTIIARADNYLLALLEIKYFEEISNSLLTLLSFEDNMDRVERKLNFVQAIMSKASTSLQKGGTLCAVLALIVKIGNYINFRSKRPVVYGIPVNALPALKVQKAFDGKKTLLRVVGDHIEDQLPIAWHDLRWLSACADITEDDVQGILDTATKYKSEITKISQWVKDPQILKANERYAPVFLPFIQKAGTRLSELEKKAKEAKSDMLEIPRLLGAAAKQTGDGPPKDRAISKVLRDLGEFGKDLVNCRKEIKDEEEAIKRRKERDMHRAACTPSKRMVSYAAAGGVSRRESFCGNDNQSTTKRGTAVRPLLSAGDHTGDLKDGGKLKPNRGDGDSSIVSQSPDITNGKNFPGSRTQPQPIRWPCKRSDQSKIEAVPHRPERKKLGNVASSYAPPYPSDLQSAHGTPRQPIRKNYMDWQEPGLLRGEFSSPAYHPHRMEDDTYVSGGQPPGAAYCPRGGNFYYTDSPSAAMDTADMVGGGDMDGSFYGPFSDDYRAETPQHHHQIPVYPSGAPSYKYFANVPKSNTEWYPGRPSYQARPDSVYSSTGNGAEHVGARPPVELIAHGAQTPPSRRYVMRPSLFTAGPISPYERAPEHTSSDNVVYYEADRYNGAGGFSSDLKYRRQQQDLMYPPRSTSSRGAQQQWNRFHGTRF